MLDAIKTLFCHSTRLSPVQVESDESLEEKDLIQMDNVHLLLNNVHLLLNNVRLLLRFKLVFREMKA